MTQKQINKLIKLVIEKMVALFSFQNLFSKNIFNSCAKNKFLSRVKKHYQKTDADKFMEDVNVYHHQGPPRKQYYLLIAIVTFFVVFIFWAYIFKIDIVTRGEGKVIPSGRTQVLQHLEGGIVKKILVKEGDLVKKGQNLMEIDDITYTAIYQEGLLKAAALEAKVARLNAEAKDQTFHVRKEFQNKHPEYVRSEYDAFIANKNLQASKIKVLEKQLDQRKSENLILKEKIKKLEVNYRLASEELEMTHSLYKDGAASKVEALKAERQLNEVKGELNETKFKLIQSHNAILEVKSKINLQRRDFQRIALHELVQAKAQLGAQLKTNITLQDRARRTVLKSPVSGIVNLVKVNTVGGIVKPGQTLIEIVPEGKTLLVEVNIRPSDIGFIHPKQKAVVKFTAYDFVIYGGLKGTVEHISADSVTNDQGKTYYIVRIRTDKDYLGSLKKPLPIIPGMTAQVDILSEKKSLLIYLIKPFLRGSKQALSER